MAEQRGFTLLEAIVALAILSAGTLALFAAIGGALRAVERAEDAARIDSAALNAIAMLESVNPMIQPDGSRPLGDIEARWRSTPVEASGPALTDYLQPGLHDVGLYDVEVTLLRDGRVERRFIVRRAGWIQMRQPEAL